MIHVNRNNSKYITYGQMNLINDFRSLWIDLIIFIRSFLVSTVTGFGNIDAIVNRLNQIPEDFKNKLQPYIGVERAERFQHLFFMQIMYIMRLITAGYLGDQPAMDAAVRDLYRNADEMSDFLASVNPHWNKSHWQNLIFQLYGMGVTEVLSLLSGDYDREIQVLDRMTKHAYLMGDYMATGIMHYLMPESPEN